jgi:LysM repeat protein
LPAAAATVARKESARTASPPTKEIRKAEPVKKPEGSVTDAGKFYVVVKGDNPVSIAKKLKVSYDELIAINHIEDPHKLQIGQKLIVPAKPAKAKKAEE